MDCIFASSVFLPAVSVATCCLSSGEASILPASKLEYHLPMSSQVANPVGAFPPAGNKVTTIWPATPVKGGISGSRRMAFTSVKVHFQQLFPASVDLTSG